MAGSFEATLSVSDRPELTSLAVTAVPIDPPAVERAAAGDGTTDRDEGVDELTTVTGVDLPGFGQANPDQPVYLGVAAHLLPPACP